MLHIVTDWSVILVEKYQQPFRGVKFFEVFLKPEIVLEVRCQTSVEESGRVYLLLKIIELITRSLFQRTEIARLVLPQPLSLHGVLSQPP